MYSRCRVVWAVYRLQSPEGTQPMKASSIPRDTLKLTLIDTVKPSAFDGSSGVRTKDGYYELAENIGVYISEQNRFISLQTAKSNYTSFRVYANKTAENGGKIRVIVAS